MDIKELTENYTREEFLEHFEKSHYGAKAYGIFKDIDCPGDIIPGSEHGKTCLNRSCKECWLNAIKDLQFKNELTITKDENLEELFQLLKGYIEYDINIQQSLYNALASEEKELKEKLENVTKNKTKTLESLRYKQKWLKKLEELIEKESK